MRTIGVLSGGMSARLFTEVRERRALCYAVSAVLNSLPSEGRVLCYAGTTVERAQETLDVTLAEMVRLGEGIELSELERCQARAKSSLIMQQESTIARAASLARDWFHLGRITTLEEVRSRIEALNVETVLEYIHAHPAADSLPTWSRVDHTTKRQESPRNDLRQPLRRLRHALDLLR